MAWNPEMKQVDASPGWRLNENAVYEGVSHSVYEKVDEAMFKVFDGFDTRMQEEIVFLCKGGER